METNANSCSSDCEASVVTRAIDALALLTSVIEPEKLGALVRQHSNVSAEHHG